MRILANENFPGEAVTALRQAGHDIAWVRVDAPGSTDEQVLQRANAESRILITFDKDFGELAFRAGLPAASGIVLFPDQRTVSDIGSRLAVTVFDSRQDWAGHFSVVEDRRIRMTPLPK